MAKDLFHEAVKKALEKDGWEITDDPLILGELGASVRIDLGAEKLLVASKGKTKIAVEIKSFLGNSVVNDFNSALGQYLGYLKLLRVKESDRLLYLAVPVDIQEHIFKIEYYKVMINDYKLKIVIYDPVNEVIVKWIN
ncbi:MAG: fatty-acid oxidation protein subunit alpha [Leptospiraceae bacterium]|nr:hypothetical protein [Leptospiraceae bacterium]MCP5500979.1 fatty-acid oxidation protein subunit alpha [Leptospiraceae bacterium]